MNQSDTQIKELVKGKYAEIAGQSAAQNKSSCCGATSLSCSPGYEVMADSYEALEGYNPDADLGLGCGLPTESAKIQEGNTVIDLGSGAGNDCFVARKLVGDSGKVIGVDMTGEMIKKARENVEKLGYNNVEFRLGDIEELPVSANTADVVISNCVLNLVPNKANVFREIFRVLKNGKHFSISDIVLVGDLPAKIQEAAEFYAGCVSGAIQKSEYINLIRQAGFTNILVQKEKKIVLPEELLKMYLDANEIAQWKTVEGGIYSITVYGEKPCCEPGSTCS